MHRYNKQDHSMLTAMMPADGIVAGTTSKSREVDTEMDDHEGKGALAGILLHGSAFGIS